MTTVFVHPDVPKYWGTHYVTRADVRVAWVDVSVLGVSRNYNRTDGRVEVVQAFINSMGWAGTVLNNYHGVVTRNRVRQSNYSSRQLKPGANGLLEHCGDSIVIIWEWKQVFKWLCEGWPSKCVSGGTSSPVGTWCYADGVDPSADHICRNKYTGWPFAMKQMRTVGVHLEVRKLERLMTEDEVIDGLCGALKNHRVILNKIHQ